MIFRVLSFIYARRVMQSNRNRISISGLGGCRLIWAVAGMVGLLGLPAPAQAAMNATVTVDVNDVLCSVPETAVGNNISVYANQMANSLLDERLAEGGVELIRHPGGSYSDFYHFSTYKSPYGYLATNSKFSNFVTLLDNVNALNGNKTQAMITVDYGSAMKNNGSSAPDYGGQAQEAAAWVAYANFDASKYGTAEDIVLGVDQQGNDWKTAGYWAKLRTSTVSEYTSWATADGVYDYNNRFLAINRDDPIGITYWEIGNEIGGNGYWGPQWEIDYHAPYNNGDTSDNTGRYMNPLLSPTAYATNLIDFATLMKQVDSTIKIGAGLDGYSSSGNEDILTTAGDYIDFAIVHWYVNNGTNTQTEDYNLLNATRTAIASQVQAVRNDFATYTNKSEDEYEIHFTEWGYFGNVTSAYVHALFTADAYATGIENNVTSMDYWEISKDHYLGDSSSLTQGTGYYAALLYSLIAEADADVLDTDTTNWKAGAHATRLEDGAVALLLINLNTTSNSDVITVNINDSTLLTKGVKWLYGETQTTPLKTILTSGLGNSFTITLPYRDMVVLIIPQHLSWYGTGADSNWNNSLNWKYGIMANDSGDPAVFSTDGHGTFNVNVNMAATVGKLTTDGLGGATQWIFNGSSVLTLDNNSSAPIIEAGVDTFINAPISGSNGLSKTGTGRLVLAGSISLAGVVDIQEGALQVNTVGAVSLADISGESLEIGNGSDATTLSADSVMVNSLSIGAGSKLVINALSGLQGMTPVPEPSAWALLTIAALGVLGTARLRKNPRF
jgi:autotransporter-associated beta strand protein